MASSHSSWQCVIGLSTSFFFFSSRALTVLFHSGSASTGKRLKAPAAAFVVNARTPRFSVSSSLCCSLFALAVSHVLSEKQVLSNLIHHSGGKIQ